jgi:hypothetical protein
MDDEQRAALAALNETTAAGFARMEHCFDAQNRLMRERLDELKSDNELRRRTGELIQPGAPARAGRRSAS